MLGFPGRDRFDLVICVNRAATKISCDVWACGDWPFQQKIQHEVIGSPLWFAAQSSVEQVEIGFSDVDKTTPCIRWRGQVKSFESLDPGIKSVDWDFFSFTAAIGYAVVAGATAITVYGADWAGVKDWDGTTPSDSRHDDRWVLERQMFTNIKNELSLRGITLDRVI